MLNISAYTNNTSQGQELYDCENHLTVVSSGYQKFTSKDWNVIREKGRKDYQVIYIVKGKGFFTFDKTAVEIAEGNIVIYSPEKPQYYKYSSRDLTEVYWVHFSGYGACCLLQDMNLLNNPAYFIGYSKDFVKIFSDIIRELQLKSPHFEEISSSLLISLIAGMARILDTSKKSVINRELEKTLKMMHSNYNRNYTVKDYARECNLSLYWFTHKFKRITGLPPTEYIRRLRINEAKYLLSNASLSIREISYIIGYENPLYFSRLFKQETGMSPTEYRKGLLL